MDRGFDTDPARCQYSNKMSARKQQYVTWHGTQTAYYAVRPGGHLTWRFAARATVAKDLPVRSIGADFGPSEAFIGAVVPLDQVFVDLGDCAESGELTSTKRTF